MQSRESRQEEVIPTNTLDKKVAIIGVGAIGSWVGLELAMMGVKTIYLYDFDEFEIHNGNRQIFLSKDMGKNKAIAFAQLIQQINPDITIFAESQKITLSEQLPKDLDYVFSCVDNFESRILLSKYQKKCNQKCIIFDGGTSEKTPTVGTALTLRKLPSGKFIEYSDFFGDLNSLLKEEKSTPSCSRNPAQAIVTTTAFSATLMVDLFRQSIAGDKHYDGLFQYSGGRRPSMDFTEYKAPEKSVMKKVLATMKR